MRIIAIILLFAAFMPFTLQGQTDGTVSYTIKTLPKSGGYSPNHVFAMWVTDNSNVLIKNLELKASKRKQYLYTWNGASGGSASDITTGSTLGSHVSHTVNWNCKNKAGTLVADGTYKIRTEFTSEHAQGPMFDISFTKSANAITLNPSATQYYTDINLIFTPKFATGVEEVGSSKYEFEVYPNPASENINISYYLNSAAKVNISIYSMNMQLQTRIQESQAQQGVNKVNWTISPEIKNGSYIVILQSDLFIATRKVLIMK